MEMWQGSSYDMILDMPSTRRQRMMLKKVELEKKRAAQSKSK